MPRSFLAFLFILSCGVGVAQAQSIDIILRPDDPACTSAEVGATPWIELHVVANLGGSVESMQGAQFKITGIPHTWNEENVSWVWDASSTIGFGNPLFAASDNWDDPGPGAVVAWNNCRAGVSGMQRIGKILLLGAPTAENITLEVEPYPLNRNEPWCPMMVQCAAPNYPTSCVSGGSFTLNGAGGSLSCAPTSVEESTWSTVKSLYQ